MSVRRSVSAVLAFLLFGIGLMGVTAGQASADSTLITVSGTVRDSLGSPVSGARLTFVGNDANFTTEVYTTDDGSYTALVIPGDMSFSVTYVGDDPDMPVEGGAGVPDLVLSENTRLDLSFPAPAHLYVHVQDNDGVAVAGAQIGLSSSSSESMALAPGLIASGSSGAEPGFSGVVTDASGDADLRLWAGTSGTLTAISSTPNDTTSQASTIVNNVSDGDSAVVALPRTVPLTGTITLMGIVNGRVKQVPAAGVEVDTSETAVSGSTLTDAAGHYTLHVAAGTPSLDITATGLSYLPHSYSISQHVVASAPATYNFNIPSMTRVPVYVMDTAGNPVEGATISMTGGATWPAIFPGDTKTTESVSDMATTDANGQASITVVQGQDYAGFTASDTFHNTPRSAFAELNPVEPGSTITLELPVLDVVSGDVEDASGTPVAGLNVISTSGAISGQATTDQSGQYELGVVPGQVSFVVAGEQAPAPLPPTFRVRSTKQISGDTANLDIHLPPTSKIALHIIDSNGADVARPGAQYSSTPPTISSLMTGDMSASIDEMDSGWQWGANGHLDLWIWTGATNVSIDSGDNLNGTQRGKDLTLPIVNSDLSETLVFPGLPLAPASGTAVPGDSAVSVSWTPPSSDGGSPITGYTVTATPAGTSAAVRNASTSSGGAVSVTVGATARSATVRSLQNGVAYVVTAAATNAVGTGPVTVAGTVTPVAGAMSVTPPSRGQGASSSTLTVHGTGFASGDKIKLSGTGVTVGTAHFVNKTTLTAPITVAATASLGARTVSVLAGTKSVGICTGCFTVAAAPHVTNSTPTSLKRGAAMQQLSVTGSGFQSGVKASLGAGVTIVAVTLVDTSHLTITVTVNKTAATGTRSLTLNNPDGGHSAKAGALKVT